MRKQYGMEKYQPNEIQKLAVATFSQEGMQTRTVDESIEWLVSACAFARDVTITVTVTVTVTAICWIIHCRGL